MRPLLAFAALLLGVGVAGAEPPAPGSQAPPFALPGSDGEVHRLSDHVGERGVVLAWFPKAFTPGWTRELEALRDSAEALARFDVAVYMVSLDTPEKNREFAESLGAEHVVLSDPLGDVARAYGVADAGASYARRWTFYIDADGTLRHVDREVDTATAGRDIARTLERLGFPKSE